MSQIINHTISDKVREVLTLRIIFFITLEPVKDFQANLPETWDNRVNWNCDVDLESIGVKRLESVETLVGAVGPPVPPHPCRPGELGNYPRHSLWFFWSKSDFKLSFELINCSSIVGAFIFIMHISKLISLFQYFLSFQNLFL